MVRQIQYTSRDGGLLHLVHWTGAWLCCPHSVSPPIKEAVYQSCYNSSLLRQLC